MYGENTDFCKAQLGSPEGFAEEPCGKSIIVIWNVS